MLSGLLLPSDVSLWSGSRRSFINPSNATARVREFQMADQQSLRLIGFGFGALTAAVVLIAGVLVAASEQTWREPARDNLVSSSFSRG